ncbi:MAG: RHS repeat-associated core domain-containing protein, partial [Chloroflexia bacterium]
RWEAGFGLYFYNARWYDPALGRFVQPDTVQPDPGDPQQLNRFAYVRNNPLRYMDPTGHSLEGPGKDDEEVEEPPPPPPPDLTDLWDPLYLECVGDIEGAEQAFLHFLADPGYFLALYADPEAWYSSIEVAHLEVFAGYSRLHMTAKDLVLGGLDSDIRSGLEAAHMMGDVSRAHSLLSAIGVGGIVAVGGVGVADLIGAAEAQYPLKAGRYEWHHYVPLYLGGNPGGLQYQIPAPYHQWITNEFRQLWGYGRGQPNPAEVHWILEQVYSKYPVPPGSPTRGRW